ncbi:MAG: helix-turn-helix domain-containing protein [Puniceicoccaceae bacterium]
MNTEQERDGPVIRKSWGSDDPLQVKRSQIGRHPIPLHRLAHHKFFLVIKGECAWESGRHRHPLRPGHLVFCEPFTPQAFHFSMRERMEYFEAIFNAPVLLERFPEWRRHASGIVWLMERRSPEPRPLFFRIPESARCLFQENFCALAEEFSRSDSAGGSLGQQFARLVLMLRDACRISARSLPEETNKRPAIERILQRIRRDFAEPLTASGLAEEAGWSSAYLSRAFKRDTGLTLTQAINRIRIEQAAHLLMATDRPVSDIATACGYNEIPYFNRRFKELLGASPTNYRLGKVHGVSAPKTT